MEHLSDVVDPFVFVPADINPFEPLAAFQDAVMHESMNISRRLNSAPDCSTCIWLRSRIHRFSFLYNPAIYMKFAGSKSLSPQALNQFRFRKRYHIDPPAYYLFLQHNNGQSNPTAIFVGNPSLLNTSLLLLSTKSNFSPVLPMSTVFWGFLLAIQWLLINFVHSAKRDGLKLINLQFLLHGKIRA